MIDARPYVTNPQGRYKVPWSDVIGIAIHHSVSGIWFSDGNEWDQGSEIQHIKQIDSYHVSQGYGGFGYHLAAFPSGRLYLCGDLDGARAHVASRNHELRGIVLIGDFTTRDPGARQVEAGAEGVAQVRATAKSPLQIAGHRTWALPQYPTSCPGDRLNARLGDMETEEDMALTQEEHDWLDATHQLAAAIHKRVLDEDAFGQIKAAIASSPAGATPEEIATRVVEALKAAVVTGLYTVTVEPA